MFEDSARKDLNEIVENEQWTKLLPYLFQRMPCPFNLQVQATEMFRVNLDLLQGLRNSSKDIVISPVLSSARGVPDYVIDDVIVEFKTSKSIVISQVCQVALYVYVARHSGLYDPATHTSRTIPKATPALHFARYGTISKVPMPTIVKDALYPPLLITTVTKLVQNRRWLGSVFDLGEVQSLCADLEAYLTTRGMLVPSIPMSPTETSILGTLMDALVKIVLARNFSLVYSHVLSELVRVSTQLWRLPR